MAHLLTLLSVAVFRNLVTGPSFEFSISRVICSELRFKLCRTLHEFVTAGNSAIFGIGAVPVFKSLVEKVVLVL